MSAELERLTAAQTAADRIVRRVADHDGGPARRLMVAVIDPETNTRLATGFATYEAPTVRHLRPVS
ncbi:hypothetical protein AB5J55_35245 [Streptomyces sp. R11]|uniref:Uncharacterized protein n=1 Tax=Streptomyces sp. R11 TaxID=3238625 RepID=A0AB39N7R6_9ACTN